MLSMHGMMGMFSWFVILSEMYVDHGLYAQYAWYDRYDRMIWHFEWEYMLIMDHMLSMHGMIGMITCFDISSGNICWSWIICTVYVVWWIWWLWGYDEYDEYDKYDVYDVYIYVVCMMSMLCMFLCVFAWYIPNYLPFLVSTIW